MKKYLVLFFLLASFTGFGQFNNYTNINGRYKWIAGKFDSTFTIPSGTTPSLRTGGGTGPGALFYRTTDSTVYQYTGTQWIKLRAGVSPTDTAGIWISNVYRKTGSDSVFYVKGGTSTFAFRDSVGNVGGGGGGGKIYYFNGGVSMGTFGGIPMYELGDTAVIGTVAQFTRATTGSIANFITDVNKPGLLQIPAGVWTIDAYVSETGGGSNHAQIWAVLEKWDGSTITTIATSPIEEITNGSVIDLYTWTISIPTTSIAVTDRIVIQFYITNTNGKTVTLYTQNGYVGEVHTTFTTGIGSLNGLTAPTQYFATGTSGTDFAISSSTATHTFNLPTASATNRGALSSTDWTTFNSKIGPSDTASMLTNYITSAGYGLSKALSTKSLSVDTTLISTRAWRQKGIDSVVNLINARPSGSGTTNYITKWTSSSALGNSLVFDNGTNVGIGNTSPSAKLDVTAANGEIRSTGTAASYTQYNAFITSGVNMRIGAYATSNGFLGTTTNHPFTIETNNSERARFTSGGNVLIGTTTDAGYKLDISGTTRISGTELRLDNGTTGVINLYSATPSIQFFSGDPTGYRLYRSSTSMALSSGGTITLQISGNNGYTLDATNGHQWRTALSGGAALARLTTGGNFMVGTTTDVASAILQLSSTTKGFLPPVMTGAQAEAIATPAAGLLVYANNGNGTTITSTGWWGYDGTTWVKLN